MAQDTLNLALPCIAPQQAQKHVTYNEAIRRLGAWVPLSARDRTRTAPPSAPARLTRFLPSTEKADATAKV